MERPKIVVGIDMGYTHTGVAYSLVQSGEIQEPRTVTSWPGKLDEVVYKVPTKVAYQAGREGPTSWGFEARPKKQKKQVVEKYFKLFLDPSLISGCQEDEEEDDEEYDPNQAEEFQNDVKKWFTDFLSLLRDWINKQIGKDYNMDVLKAKVEYIFSVPTTWKPAVVEDYRKIIINAGYTKEAGHTAKIGLTEAEAAAVYTSIERSRTAAGRSDAKKYQKGDILLVCDAGGGTTDVSILKVDDFENDIPQLTQLHYVEGDIAGSVKIDEQFQELVKRRLAVAKNLPLHPTQEDIVQRMNEAFQIYKHTVGTSSVSLLTVVLIPLLGNSPDQVKVFGGYSDEDARIQNGNMQFYPSEIEDLFESQIEKILKLLDNQLTYFRQNNPQDVLKYLVFSGGLGSSAYVHQRVREHLISNIEYPAARNIEILISNEPQLVVCRGIVLNQLQEYFKVYIINGRRSRESYGITYDEPWDKTKHPRGTPYVKHSDGEYYVPGKIYWLIKKNDFVSRESPPKAARQYALSYRKSSKIVRHEIVKYTGYEDPPDRVDPATTPTVCTLEVDLGPAISARTQLPKEAKIQRRAFLNVMRTRRFLNVVYEIQVTPGPADLKFELWFAGEKRNKTTEVKIDWKAEGRVVGYDHGDNVSMIGTDVWDSD